MATATPPKGPANRGVRVPWELRDRTTRRDIDFKSFAAHVTAAESRERYVVCQLEPDYWTEVNGLNERLDDLDMGGISGGPAFLVERLAYPLD